MAALRRVNAALDGDDAEVTFDALVAEKLQFQDLDDAGCVEYHTNLKAAKKSKAREVHCVLPLDV